MWQNLSVTRIFKFSFFGGVPSSLHNNSIREYWYDYIDQCHPQLQSSMYFFLSYLSVVDVWFSSNVTPKMLENLLSETKTIFYVGCLVQCYFFIALVHVEVYILAVMAFDRYMAICNPLLYGSKMS